MQAVVALEALTLRDIRITAGRGGLATHSLECAALGDADRVRPTAYRGGEGRACKPDMSHRASK